MEIVLLAILWVWASVAGAFYAETELAESHYKINIGTRARLFSAFIWPMLVPLLLARSMARKNVRQIRDQKLERECKAATK